MIMASRTSVKVTLVNKDCEVVITDYARFGDAKESFLTTSGAGPMNIPETEPNIRQRYNCYKTKPGAYKCAVASLKYPNNMNNVDSASIRLLEGDIKMVYHKDYCPEKLVNFMVNTNTHIGGYNFNVSNAINKVWNRYDWFESRWCERCLLEGVMFLPATPPIPAAEKDDGSKDSSLNLDERDNISLNAHEPQAEHVGLHEPQADALDLQALNLHAPQANVLNLHAPQDDGFNLHAPQDDGLNLYAPQADALNLPSPEANPQQADAVNLHAPQANVPLLHLFNANILHQPQAIGQIPDDLDSDNFSDGSVRSFYSDDSYCEHGQRQWVPFASQWDRDSIFTDEESVESLSDEEEKNIMINLKNIHPDISAVLDKAGKPIGYCLGTDHILGDWHYGLRLEDEVSGEAIAFAFEDVLEHYLIECDEPRAYEGTVINEKDFRA